MLKKIANSIRENKNIIEKREIDPIVQIIQAKSYKSSRVFSDIGEDSASILDNEKFILMTTDRIKTDYILKNPFGAGFSSILVGIDDIYCCGGTPLAASLIVSFKNKQIGEKIFEGAMEGSQKFQVPIVRGHTRLNGNYYELSSTMIGEIKKSDYISAKNAKYNDDIILAVDFLGRIPTISKYYWDTVTFKQSEEVLLRRRSMNMIAQQHLANSAKDISNAGIFGTILQLIKYSNVGAKININKIKIPPFLVKNGYDLETYIKMYLTTSYILSAPEDKSNDILKIFDKHFLTAKIIGKIIKDEHLLKISDGNESLDVLKF
ncbi:MAG: AIR synthase related protein [Promethearchaeota archaeon]